jgi:hypothetical protein
VPSAPESQLSLPDVVVDLNVFFDTVTMDKGVNRCAGARPAPGADPALTRR